MYNKNIDKKEDYHNHMKDKIIIKLKAFIPQKISNKTVLTILTILSGLHRVRETVIRSNAAHNATALLNKKVYDPRNYIENQNEWAAVRFGRKYSMCYSGCEIIAVCNAFRALGKGVSAQFIVTLISAFERRGAVLGGFFGTAPYAVEKYFKENGYPVTATDSMDREIIDEIARKSDTVIVVAYNDKNDIMKQVHTVSITKEEDKTYSVHNAYYRVDGRYRAKSGYRTLQDAINGISGSHPASIYVIGIG